MPYGDFRPEELNELTEAEQKRFEDSLATDPDFQNEVQAMVNRPAPGEGGDLEGSHRPASQVDDTLMSPEVVDELVADAAEKERLGNILVGRDGTQGRAATLARHRPTVTNAITASTPRWSKKCCTSIYLANVGSSSGHDQEGHGGHFANFGTAPSGPAGFLCRTRAADQGRPPPNLGRRAQRRRHLRVATAQAPRLGARRRSHPLPHDFRLET